MLATNGLSLGIDGQFASSCWGCGKKSTLEAKEILGNGNLEMILIDDRVGSVHYAKSLLPSSVERLEFGDICFEGNNGQLIGCEVKKIADCVSSLLSGRLADHQLPGMLGLYDVSYLIVEGYYRCDPDSGLVQGWQGRQWRDIHSGRNRLTWAALDGWLTSIETLTGIRIRRTTTEAETVATIQSLYHWWQKEDHKSLRVFNTSQDAAAVERPGLLRRMAAELPMIGWQRSVDVANKFKSVRTMVNAPIEDWLEIEGIGKTIAMKIQLALDKER